MLSFPTTSGGLLANHHTLETRTTRTNIQPVIEDALTKGGLQARLEQGGKDNDKLMLHYPSLTKGTGYIAPVVTLEFGGRATGEPHEIHSVGSDIAEHLGEIDFPTASPQVMSLARTFWEKATAAHVFCAQGRLRGERYARHWHDLAAISRSEHYVAAVSNHAVASAVAQHKSHFFIEKDLDGKVIDYVAATTGICYQKGFVDLGITVFFTGMPGLCCVSCNGCYARRELYLIRHPKK